MRSEPASVGRRRLGNTVFLGMIWVSGVVGILLPASIVVHLLANGGKLLDPSFLLDRPRGTPLGSAGGIFPAIAGSVSLVGIGLAVAFPMAIGGALYLSEFSRSARGTRAARLVIESLAAVPSIVYGLFGYAFFVVLLRMGTSLAAGSLVLAIVMFPIILITAQEAFDAVPRDYREAALALGVDRYEWVLRVLLPKSATRISGRRRAGGRACGGVGRPDPVHRGGFLLGGRNPTRPPGHDAADPSLLPGVGGRVVPERLWDRLGPGGRSVPLQRRGDGAAKHGPGVRR